MSARRGWLLSLCLVVLAGCNEFDFSPPGAGSPTQVSALATTGGIDVHWSAMDEAIGYGVFVSTDGSLVGAQALCTGPGQQSPCEVREGIQEGLLYYVRVTTVLEGDEGFDLDKVADQEVLAVRRLYTQQRGGIFAWAGFGRLEQNDSVHLEGGWYEDETAPDSVHRCTVFWGGGAGESAPIEPCASTDLSLGGDFSVTYPDRGTYYPVLEVESDDGRFGQALTTVVTK